MRIEMELNGRQRAIDSSNPETISSWFMDQIPDMMKMGMAGFCRIHIYPTEPGEVPQFAAVLDGTRADKRTYRGLGFLFLGLAGEIPMDMIGSVD